MGQRLPKNQVINMWKEGYSDMEISKVIGSSRRAVYNILRRSGRPKSQRKFPLSQAIDLYQQGLPIWRVSKLLDLSAPAVWIRLKALGLTRPRGYRHMASDRPVTNEAYLGIDGYWYMRGKVNGKTVKRAWFNWEKDRCRKRPLGNWWHIHHIDGNIENDDPSNLRLVRRKTHHRIHMNQLQRQRYHRLISEGVIRL